MGNKRMLEQSVHDNMNDYERSKMLRVQENQERLRQLGVKNIAKSFTSLVEGDKKKKRKKKTIGNDKSVDYNPDSCSESKKDDYVVATRAKQLQKQNRPQYIAPMAMNRYANLTKKRVSASNVSCVLPAMEGCQSNGKSLGQNASKNNQSRATVTMAQLLLSKKGPSRPNRVNFNSKEMDSATKSISSGPKRKLFDMRSDDINSIEMEHDCAENDDEDNEESSENETDGDDTGSQELNEYEREQHDLVDDENEDPRHIMFGNNQNGIELGSDSEDESENEIAEQIEEQTDDPELLLNKAAISTTKRRSPTMMHDIHVRDFDARETIICNKFGQPIGPVTKEKDTVGQFSRFLGTSARMSSYAPLTYTSWPKVPHKEMMWKYVLEKYIVPDKAKSWVLMTIGACWKG